MHQLIIFIFDLARKIHPVKVRDTMQITDEDFPPAKPSPNASFSIVGLCINFPGFFPVPLQSQNIHFKNIKMFRPGAS
ncbi:MAG: hypothetical protein V1706_02225 [Pseudomonadota bacterium]